MDKLRTLIEALASSTPIDPAYQDHPLRGPWRGHREAHLAPDWLLIYKVEGEELRLVPTGRHVDVFRE